MLDNLGVFEVPIIKTVNVNVKTFGKYKTPSGMPKGLVIHYTAGRSLAGHQDAVNTLNNLSYLGLGCLVMATDGTLYKAQNQSIDDVALHAGKSAWLDKTFISSYCMGIEVCCAGAVTEFSDGFKSWFGEKYTRDQVRHVNSKINNQKPGFYHKFTPEQEFALWRFCKWQRTINPEFDFNWVVGHDEIAPKRKLDPGGSLSCSMPEFREILMR